MITRPDRVLHDLAGKLMQDITLDITSRYGQANAVMMADLMHVLAEQAEWAVANRHADLEALRALFTREAAAGAPGAAARRRFCDRQPASLRLSDVDALHAEGLRLLIALHRWAEAEDAALDRAIWQFLHDHAARNRLEVSTL